MQRVPEDESVDMEQGDVDVTPRASHDTPRAAFGNANDLYRPLIDHDDSQSILSTRWVDRVHILCQIMGVVVIVEGESLLRTLFINDCQIILIQYSLQMADFVDLNTNI